jgi:hypothetical protein
MPDTAFKQRERDAAAFWGTLRAANNSSGRPDYDGSDSLHPRIHLETKLRKTQLRSLWESAKKKALKFRVKKTPVLMVAQKNCPGFLVCVHSDDFELACQEWLVCQDEDTITRISNNVRTLRMLRRTNGC